MTFFRHEARGSLPDGEFYTFGIHTSKAAGVIGDAHSAWDAAIDILWNGATPGVDGIDALYAASVTVDELVTTQLDAVTGRNELQEVSAPALVGTGTGGGLPQEVAVCVSLRTALPTRAGRGRFYLPGPILTTCANSRLDPTAQARIAVAAANMLTAMRTSTYVPVILHRATPTAPPSATTCTATDVGDVFDSMRTRRDKLREVRVSFTI